ncbi:MAG: hypothetical protein AB1898_31655 [Acidobacteriota bacterium]
MATKNVEKPRPHLAKARDEAKRTISAQLEKGGSLPNVSINDNDEAKLWYEYTEELLRQLFTTDDLADEFTGVGDLDWDISTKRYLKTLKSIFDRLDLFPETIAYQSLKVPTAPLDAIERLAAKFHRVVRLLRRRHDGRATLDVCDEYDVQDLMHSLLSLYFDDIRPEEWTPSYAGGSSRMDFLLKPENIVIEVKKTRERLANKELVDQLAIDILRYAAHPDCRTLVCFIYDPEERVSNPKGFERDLGRSTGHPCVKVFLAQK